jgi:hypothetical protein
MFKKIELETCGVKHHKETIVKLLEDPTIVAKDKQHSSLEVSEHYGEQVQMDASQDR